MATRSRLPRVPERVEQQHVVTLLRSIGAAVYVLGTTRRRGDYQGTMQTAGVADVLAFLPPSPTHPRARLLCVECKAVGGRLSAPQVEFRMHCVAADVAHVTGDLDAVITWLIAERYLRRDRVPHYRLEDRP